MKKSIILMMSVVCFTSVAFGQGRVGPFLTGMVSTGDESGSAFGAGVKCEWLFSPMFGIDAHVGYVNDGDIGLIPLELGPIAVFPLDNSLFLTLGAGALYGIPQGSDADAALGFYLSGGIRGPLAEGMEWFAEAQYVSVEGDDDRETISYGWGYSISSSEKLDFSGLGLNAGVLWKF